MTKTITTKLMATVVEVANLGELFPASVLRGRIGLDVRVEQGSLSPGKKVRLCGPDSEEVVEILGIEMLSDPHDPSVVRIHCSKPKVLGIPTGRTEGWIVAE